MSRCELCMDELKIKRMEPAIKTHFAWEEQSKLPQEDLDTFWELLSNQYYHKVVMGLKCTCTYEPRSRTFWR